jgi:hypothetical protein
VARKLSGIFMPNQELTAEQLATNAALEASLTQSERDMLNPPPGRVRLTAGISSGWSAAKPVQASVTAPSSSTTPVQASVEAPFSDAKKI